MITHEQLINLGFELYDSEDDPYYKLIFTPPFNFGVQELSGYLEDGVFDLFGYNGEYISYNDLKNLINIFSKKENIVTGVFDTKSPNHASVNDVFFDYKNGKIITNEWTT